MQADDDGAAAGAAQAAPMCPNGQADALAELGDTMLQAMGSALSHHWNPPSPNDQSEHFAHVPPQA